MSRDSLFMSVNSIDSATSPPTIGSSAPIQVVAGRYQLERILGVGGMAIVFRAFDRLAAHFNHPSPYVALKIFKEEFAGFTDANYLLYSEYALLATLNHPNIVRSFQFDIDATTERAFLTLEFLKGMTLDQWLIENPLGTNLPKITPMLLEIIDAVDYSHQHNIVHGDLKPSNIMLTQNGCVLFDFGLGQMLSGDLSILPKISRKRFNAWTPKYAAPELLEDISLTTKTDIFALSCIIYELLTGQNPYYIDKKTKYTVKPTKPKDLSKKQWAALCCGLAIKPHDRLITAQELKNAFQPYKKRYFYWF
ncbi:serine/threonine protein kinase [Gammaproteobacteria bacterium ESL0073]|nr:serine/threonine protein kinase [Gammaproteobacteria bacterium ESL0073]